MPAGYSGTPLAKKLGIKPGMRVVALGAPARYGELVAPLPDGAAIVDRLAKNGVAFVHLFAERRGDLARRLERAAAALDKAGTLWVSWPKKASKVPTDVTEDVVRELAFPLGLVDVKVCAVDEIWSGLKLVYRLENR